MKLFRALSPALVMLAAGWAFAQPEPQRILAPQIIVSPNAADWTYEPGDPVIFTVQVLSDGLPVEDAEVELLVGPEKFEESLGAREVPAGGLKVDAGTMEGPGFLRLIASATIDGRSYRGLATAAFAPEKIQPTQVEPEDFDAFWNEKKAELAEVPVNLTKKLMPERSTAAANVYHVSYDSWSHWGPPDVFYGALAEPTKPGKYPAILFVPGAGVRPYHGDSSLAGEGAIVLNIGIHGIPVNLEGPVYDNLRGAALDGYPEFFLDNRDRYYYLRVYMGCVRALDVLTEHPYWDGETLIVAGGSQGGQLSIVTSALDERVTGTVSNYPAYCDVTGYLHDRAGGWPHMFARGKNRDEDKIRTTGYYDAVNFARRLRAPISFALGFNDEVCPPTSMYAAYNVIEAPKELLLQYAMGHSSNREFSEVFRDRVREKAGLATEK